MKLGVIILLGVVFIMIGLGESIGEGRTTGSEEERAAEMCALMDGVGECRVMMTYSGDKEARVFAVLVLCDGAESVEVRERITSLFCSLYGIGSHRVEIQRLKR